MSCKSLSVNPVIVITIDEQALYMYSQTNLQPLVTLQPLVELLMKLVLMM